MREIADALGLSYQRVHQIVDTAAGKGAVKECRTTAVCSFCGADKSTTRRLIGGPGELLVCEQCVIRAQDLIAGRARDANEQTRLVSVDPVNDNARCAFCGKKRQRVASMVEAPNQPLTGTFTKALDVPRICDLCLALCDEILSEALTVTAGRTMLCTCRGSISETTSGPTPELVGVAWRTSQSAADGVLGPTPNGRYGSFGIVGARPVVAGIGHALDLRAGHGDVEMLVVVSQDARRLRVDVAERQRRVALPAGLVEHAVEVRRSLGGVQWATGFGGGSSRDSASHASARAQSPHASSARAV